MPSNKVIDKIKSAQAEKRPFYSFEFFPPKTNAGVDNLFRRIERMCSLEPGFIDVTWGAGGSTARLTMQICAEVQTTTPTDVMMHITCTNISKDTIKSVLEVALKNGITNILALRGDPLRGAEEWEPCKGGFSHASELVKYIREEFGQRFGIAVAGYPEGHISSISLDDDIKHLKEKVDAGADFVLTQMFFDIDVFMGWRGKCRDAGIKCPIIPGIMPIQNYNGFKRMTSFCRTKVPLPISQALFPIQHDDERVKNYGVTLAIAMCRRLLDNQVEGIHFYTLNLEKSVTQILEGLGFVTCRRDNALPWKQSLVARRGKEDVRPIFWANRPDSYLDRTQIWDEFPNGRWGSSASPAFGELNDYHLSYREAGHKTDRLQIWGNNPKTEIEIYDVFTNYIDGKIARLPWCESQIQMETLPIKKVLIQMNRSGYLTINSQPQVNGAPSSDPAVGWGGPGGYVYQKAYLEFFTPKENLQRLQDLVQQYPAMHYTAINAQGTIVSNHSNSVNAVTWGVFPGKEIQQPTIVDNTTFTIWKDEAFALWLSQWQVLYVPESPSFKLLQNIHDAYYLVNIVDNDYIHGDMFAFFGKLMEISNAK